jgi:hypothetical protein
MKKINGLRSCSGLSFHFRLTIFFSQINELNLMMTGITNAPNIKQAIAKKEFEPWLPRGMPGRRIRFQVPFVCKDNAPVPIIIARKKI